VAIEDNIRIETFAKYIIDISISSCVALVDF